eukprot:4933543-Pyramimonas_sp.AAC.2
MQVPCISTIFASMLRVYLRISWSRPATFKDSALYDQTLTRSAWAVVGRGRRPGRRPRLVSCFGSSANNMCPCERAPSDSCMLVKSSRGARHAAFAFVYSRPL